MKNIVENQGIKNDKPVPLSYEQLKARLDAVVAECAHVKDVSNWSLKTGMTASRDAFHVGCDAEDCLHDAVHAMLKHLPTPATSAALAEVEAKAIEKFAAQQEEKLKAAALIGATHLETCHEFAALQARAYSVELREGRV